MRTHADRAWRMVYSCLFLSPLFLTMRTNLNGDPTACMLPRWLADAKLHGLAKIKLNVFVTKHHVLLLAAAHLPHAVSVSMA
jgi:hypothetical protein